VPPLGASATLPRIGGSGAVTVKEPIRLIVELGSGLALAWLIAAMSSASFDAVKLAACDTPPAARPARASAAFPTAL
jgi:hypothetical protein